MLRRDFLQLLAAAGLLPTTTTLARPTFQARPRLFFESAEIDRIRDATQSFRPAHFERYLAADLDEAYRLIDEAHTTRDYVAVWRDLRVMLERESLVFLVTGDAQRGRAVMEALDVFLARDHWDYFMDAGGERLGFQRAPESTVAVLFAMEVLTHFDPEYDTSDILKSVAEKGCRPCFHALMDMKRADETTDWQFDPEYVSNYDVDMSKWPTFFDRNNLKAIPIAGLGLAALAVAGHDDRSEGWLARADEAAREWLSLISEDGSYFEGLSYADYSLRYLTTFFEGSMRVRPQLDWTQEAPFSEVTRFVLACQMGVRADGERRDVVNFSDSNFSFHPAPLLWIAKRAQDGRAQYAARHFSDRSGFTDWTQFDPGVVEVEPPRDLLNVRLDLDWIVARTGWADDSNVIAFRSGMPANHEHADRNAFIFKAYGERLLTDHYGASYDWRQPGWLLRTSKGHNSVLINGEGHQYVDGSEGTNASLAEARITDFGESGNHVWWTSDATQAYQLVTPDVTFVARSILFIKPDILIVVDRVRAAEAVEMTSRFHPDNTDGLTRIEIDGRHFSVGRPAASLSAAVASDKTVRVVEGMLDLPIEDLAHLGDGEVEQRTTPGYRFVDLVAESARETTIVTALGAFPGEPNYLPEVSATDGGWMVVHGSTKTGIRPEGDIVRFSIG